MAQARKLIETKQEGEYEICKWHITYFELNEEDLGEIWDGESDDYECAYHNGMVGDMDGDLICLDANNFIRFCKNELDARDEEDYPSKETYKSMIKSINKYKGYTIYPSRKDSPKEKEVKNV